METGRDTRVIEQLRNWNLTLDLALAGGSLARPMNPGILDVWNAVHIDEARDLALSALL
jgi:hypothetical protein